MTRADFADHVRRVVDQRTTQSEDDQDATPSPRRLVVGAADDRCEREADATAALVVRALTTSVRDSDNARVRRSTTVSPAPETRPAPQRVQRAGIGVSGGEVDVDTDQAIRRARGGGRPLPEETRAPMEQAFGADFGKVRIHEGADTAALSDRIQAKAFTVANDVFFRDGLPGAASRADQHLLAHELTHTVQQGSAPAAAGGVAARVRRAPATVRRMPTMATVKDRSNKKSKSGTKIFGKKRGATNTYNALLAAVDSYDKYKSTKIATRQNEITEQLGSIHRRVDAVTAAAVTYTDRHDPNDDASTVAQDLIDMAFYEKRAASDIAAHFARKATSDPFGLGGSTWRMELPRDPRNYQMKAADTRGTTVTATGDAASDKGNNKEVAKVTSASGTTGFFAQGSEGGKYDEIDPTAAGTDNDLWIGPRFVLGGYGVTDQNLNLDNRSIAMSRLDRLLNGGLIARTEAAHKGDKTGTFQELAKGKQGQKLLIDGEVPVDDGNFARLLSRLQLIDAIAGQVDRHAGNYFVQRDKSGKVTGVTGIDLDMSWIPEGNADNRGNFDLERGSAENKGKWKGEKIDWYPGFSKFVDKEMAEAIIALDPNDLRLMLMDLIAPNEIEAAIGRLTQLQGLLTSLQKAGQLLEPKDWNAQVRAKLLAEKKSYYAEIAGRAQ